MVEVEPTRRSVDSSGVAAGTRRLERQVVEMVVHDLQNPLAGIMAFLEILKDRPDGLTSAENKGLTAAVARCQELSELVVTLLQLGQAERGELRPELETVDLGRVARSAAEAFAPVAQRGQQALRFHARKSSSTITRTDERIVRRILYNLTRNALRHTPAGTTVQLAVETDPALQIVVEDDGPGIPGEIQDRIFEPGALRRAGVPSDSGVGLAFCRKAAESLGMSLRFEKSRDGGCRFVLGAPDSSHDQSTTTIRQETARGVCV